MGHQEPPIRNLSSQEIYQRLWIEEGCFRESLQAVLELIEPCPEISICFELIKESLEEIDHEMRDEAMINQDIYSEKFKTVRSTLA